MFPVFKRSVFITTAQYQSRLLWSRHDRALQRAVGWQRRRRPVRLVEVDVKRPCPVGKDAFLSDEAVVAATPPALVGNVHATLIWASWFIVVVRHRVMLRLPAVRKKKQS